MQRRLPLPCQVLIILLATAVVFLPQVSLLPGPDSGVFLYIGQRVLEGAIPYRDLWDNKGPALFYLDALGLYVSGGHLWGVWLLEWVSLSLAAWLGYLTLRNAFGRISAVFGTAVWILSAVRVLEGGNLVEQWALPLQFGAVCLFVSDLKDSSGSSILWRTMLVGALGAGAILLRANLIGVWIAIWIFWMFTNLRQGLLRTAYLSVSAAVVFGVTAWYFSWHNALGQMWDAVIGYNGAYTTLPGHEKRRVGAVLFGTGLMDAWPLIVGAWAIALYTFTRRMRTSEVNRGILWVAVVLLPIEMVLAAVSGRKYPHYFMAWLPAVAILAGYFAWWLLSFAQGERATAARPKTYLDEAIILLVAVVAGTAIAVFPVWYYQADADRSGKGNTIFEAAEFVKSATGPNDTILVWGFEGYVYYLSGRRSPTRFFYQYPLAAAGYGKESLAREFVSALRQDPPRVIVDAGDPKLPRLSPGGRYLSPQKRAGWKNEDDGNYTTLPSSINPFFELLDDRYIRVKDISTWAVYVLK
jgi:hypothetical protein